MWNGWFLDGTKCPTFANHMHSPIIGGYMVRAAMSAEYADDPYFLSLAYGFVSHPIADAVGFATQGGYLGNESSTINWELEWPFMLAVDSYWLRAEDAIPTVCEIPSSAPTTSLEQKGIDFIAAVNAQYVLINPSFPALNSTQVQACSDPWGPQVNVLNAYAQKLSNSSMTDALLFFDRFGAKTLEDAATNLRINAGCVDLVLQYYFSHIADASVSVEQVWQNTNDYVTSLYAEGQCTYPWNHNHNDENTIMLKEA
jgi:hypothetical protein